MDSNNQNSNVTAGSTPSPTPSPREVGSELHQNPGLDDSVLGSVRSTTNSLAAYTSATAAFGTAMNHMPQSAQARSLVVTVSFIIGTLERQVQDEKETSRRLQGKLETSQNRNEALAIELAATKPLIEHLRASKRIQVVLSLVGSVLITVGFKIQPPDILAFALVGGGLLLVLCGLVWPSGNSK